jgi:monoamine oxidase
MFLEDQVPQDTVLNELVARFGEEARNPVDYVEQNWTHEPFQSGCVQGLPRDS